MLQIQVTWTYCQLTTISPELLISELGLAWKHGTPFSSCNMVPWHHLSMAGIYRCKCMIMHARTRGLLGMFQAESPNKASPMHSSFVIRDLRRKFLSQLANESESTSSSQCARRNLTNRCNEHNVTTLHGSFVITTKCCSGDSLRCVSCAPGFAIWNISRLILRTVHPLPTVRTALCQ